MMRTRIGGLFVGMRLLKSSVFAQAATVRGQVSDESGAVIPGAKVTAAGPGGVVKTTSADSNGTYTLAGLALGSYAIQASAPQLAMAQPIKIELKPGLQTLNLQLKVASVVEKMTVEENTGPMDSTEAPNTASALVLRGEDLEALSGDPTHLM